MELEDRKIGRRSSGRGREKRYDEAGRPTDRNEEELEV